MNRKARQLLAASLVLIGLTAAFLAYARAHQQLGAPGLRLVAGELRDDAGNVAATEIVDLPINVLEYRSDMLPVTREELDWLPPDTTYGSRRYVTPEGRWLDLRVVLMGTDRTSIHKPEYCLPGQGFQIRSATKDVIRIPKPRPYDLPVTRIVASRTFRASNGATQDVSAVFVYWFVADDRLSADHLQRMWWMARDLLLTGTLQRWAYVSCLSLCHPGEEETAFQHIAQFLAASVPEFQTTTPPSGF